MTYQELRERIAKMLFRQTTMEMESEWELRNEWVKDMYRKETDQIFNLIKEAGWVILPKDQSLSER